MKCERLLSPEKAKGTLSETRDGVAGNENRVLSLVPGPDSSEDWNVILQRTEEWINQHSRENGYRVAKEEYIEDSSNKQVIEIRRSRANEKRKHVFSDEALNTGFFKKFFKQKRQLGKGSFGITYECDHVLDKFVLGTYAVKVISLHYSVANLRALLKEIKLMDILKHPNIVGFRHAWVENYQPAIDGPRIPCMFISMEYASEGDLYSFIIDDSEEGRIRRKREMFRTKNPPVKTALGGGLGPHTGHKCLEEAVIWNLFQDLTMALHYIHIKGVCHRDIKPDNILLTKTIRRVKRTSRNNWEPEYHSSPKCLITDFGAAILLDKDGIVIDDIGGGAMDESFGNCHFSGPEVRESNWTTKADIWSLGLVLYFMAFARVPFEQISSRSVMYQCLSKGKELDFPYEHMRSPEMVQLIKSMTSRNPNKRPSASQVNRMVTEIVLKHRQQKQITPSYVGEHLEGLRSIADGTIEHGYKNYLDLTTTESRNQLREYWTTTSPRIWSTMRNVEHTVEDMVSPNLGVVALPMLDVSPAGGTETIVLERDKL